MYTTLAQSFYPTDNMGTPQFQQISNCQPVYYSTPYGCDQVPFANPLGVSHPQTDWHTSTAVNPCSTATVHSGLASNMTNMYSTESTGMAHARTAAPKHAPNHPKPPYSYIALICMGIAETAEKKATLRDIIKYIEKNFAYYRSNKKWHGAIRHNLTINDCFVKLPRRPGVKSCLWTIDPAFKDMFDNGSLRRRRYRFKESTENWSSSKINTISRKISRKSQATPAMRSSSAADSFATPGVLGHTVPQVVTPFISPPLDHQPNPEFTCSYQSAPSPAEHSPASVLSLSSSVEDLDEILNTISNYDNMITTACSFT